MLPILRRSPFSARATHHVWVGGETRAVDDTLHILEALGTQLMAFVHSRDIGKTILPPLGTFAIENGSYLFQMPTQGGRQAMVIFPPSKQSLDDIRYMCDFQEEELPDVQTLRSVALEGDGGCKCFLVTTELS